MRVLLRLNTKILFNWLPVRRLGFRRAGLPSLSKKICVRFLKDSGCGWKTMTQALNQIHVYSTSIF
ncbi:hypothetical protein HanXRQr2_Chr11g0488861 [Helianthus annuus]|uniref:Uncharacterized protein n=1 Tax=Helianthus annuus TaxID=4232 RepID=A0A9K3MZV1_HELAN|nr:hypothetical protein HanXRQr2_Chr11g0488861 [Helianthus annuus]KAJ0875011.1 hypothetical protein HanPSC8_Chr11g0471161 [Helianthus annuus]